jgi:hypothetical protein
MDPWVKPSMFRNAWLHSASAFKSCVPRTQRSAPLLRRGALQSRGPGFLFGARTGVPDLRCHAARGGLSGTPEIRIRFSNRHDEFNTRHRDLATLASPSFAKFRSSKQ